MNWTALVWVNSVVEQRKLTEGPVCEKGCEMMCCCDDDTRHLQFLISLIGVADIHAMHVEQAESLKNCQGIKCFESLAAVKVALEHTTKTATKIIIIVDNKVRLEPKVAYVPKLLPLVGQRHSPTSQRRPTADSQLGVSGRLHLLADRKRELQPERYLSCVLAPLSKALKS